jgi:hypothetical protein
LTEDVVGGNEKSPIKPNEPYRVNFNHADVPSTPDHSKHNPGPPGGGADRAGYTRAVLTKKASVGWDNGEPRADGMVPLFATAVNVDFALDPITVAISSDYDEGSCPYRVTLKHEVEDHVKPYIAIFLSYRDRLVTLLNGIKFPTKSTPTWIRPNNIEAFQDALGEKLKAAIQEISSKLKSEMDADRRVKDSPEAYKAIYRQCPPDEW